jgi:hypothetical protein
MYELMPEWFLQLPDFYGKVRYSGFMRLTGPPIATLMLRHHRQ